MTDKVKALSEAGCCNGPLDDEALERLREVYAPILALNHGRDGKENAIRVLFATIAADRKRLAELESLLSAVQTWHDSYGGGHCPHHAPGSTPDFLCRMLRGDSAAKGEL